MLRGTEQAETVSSVKETRRTQTTVSPNNTGFHHVKTNGHEREANTGVAESTPMADGTITVKRPAAGSQLEK